MRWQPQFSDLPGEITAFRAALHGHRDPQARDDFWRIAASMMDRPETRATIDLIMRDLERLGDRYEPSPFELDMISELIAHDPLLRSLWLGVRRGRTSRSTVRWFGLEMERAGAPAPFVTYATTQLAQRLEAGHAS